MKRILTMFCVVPVAAFGLMMAGCGSSSTPSRVAAAQAGGTVQTVTVPATSENKTAVSTAVAAGTVGTNATATVKKADGTSVDVLVPVTTETQAAAASGTLTVNQVVESIASNSGGSVKVNSTTITLIIGSTRSSGARATTALSIDIDSDGTFPTPVGLPVIDGTTLEIDIMDVVFGSGSDLLNVGQLIIQFRNESNLNTLPTGYSFQLPVNGGTLENTTATTTHDASANGRSMRLDIEFTSGTLTMTQTKTVSNGSVTFSPATQTTQVPSDGVDTVQLITYIP